MATPDKTQNERLASVEVGLQSLRNDVATIAAGQVGLQKAISDMSRPNYQLYAVLIAVGGAIFYPINQRQERMERQYEELKSDQARALDQLDTRLQREARDLDVTLATRIDSLNQISTGRYEKTFIALDAIKDTVTGLKRTSDHFIEGELEELRQRRASGPILAQPKP